MRHYRLVHSWPSTSLTVAQSFQAPSVFIGYIGTDSIGSLIKRFAAKKAGVEDGRINNQRKAFLDMLAWSEELITDVRNQKSWLWRHCRRRAIYRLLRSPRKLVTLNPNSNQQAPDATSFFPVGGMPTASSLAWKTFRKVRTLWHCSRLRSVALYLWLIVVISVRQSTAG